ncbi:MAG: hemerythrin family protein [Bacteriovoracaceae bacterium]|nr:hemerythrin family protein [Bacteriovoracaceae bacterium]
MAIIEWSNDLSVKVNSIDTQHKKLIEYINQLHDGMMEGKGNDVLSTILEGLVDYTAKHFKYEEMLFLTHGYDDAEAHKAEHAALVAKVVAFKEDFAQGKATLSSDIMEFLRDWLTDHIQGTDMKYSAFLTEKGVQ